MPRLPPREALAACTAVVFGQPYRRARLIPWMEPWCAPPVPPLWLLMLFAALRWQGNALPYRTRRFGTRRLSGPRIRDCDGQPLRWWQPSSASVVASFSGTLAATDVENPASARASASMLLTIWVREGAPSTTRACRNQRLSSGVGSVRMSDVSTFALLLRWSGHGNPRKLTSCAFRGSRCGLVDPTSSGPLRRRCVFSYAACRSRSLQLPCSYGPSLAWP